MVVIILFLNDELFLLKDLEKDFPTDWPRVNYYIDFQVNVIVLKFSISALQWRIFKSITFALKQTMLLYLMKRLEVLVPRVLDYHPLWPRCDLCDLAFLRVLGGKAGRRMPANHQC